jgi:hypothetical protein
MVLITALVLVAYARVARAASEWDDFSNNLAADLAPILQLFGEQVTKQYLAESTSTLDCIIFAMAPLGVLTAIVSTIRVCGGSLLKAFVGRIQESSGVAELELCSSTGRDIVELYQGGAIARVFGRAKILEFIHNPHLEHSVSDDGTPTHGIYTFMQYQEQMLGGLEWGPVKWPRDMDWSKRTPRPTGSEIAAFVGDMNNPNLILNIGLRRLSQSMLICVAAFGVLLQASVLGFAVWVTRVEKLQKEDKVPPTWALSMTIVGTTLLCAGMFMCAYMIERRTNECSFSRSQPSCDPTPQNNGSDKDSERPRTTLYWVQPGAQVVGDQTFDSFAYSDSTRPLPHYTVSWMRPIKSLEHKLTWVVSIVTILAFIMQFIGLRGLHAAVSVYQIAAVLVMSMLRAMLRTKRLDLGKHLFTQSPEGMNPGIDVTGHELDCLAFEMYRSRHGGLSAMETSFHHTWMLLQHGAEDAKLDTNVAMEGLLRIEGTNMWTPIDHGQVRDWPKEETAHPTAAAIWRYRARLGELTSAGSRYKQSRTWDDEKVKGRLKDCTTARAISASASLILRHFNNVERVFLDFACSVFAAADPVNSEFQDLQRDRCLVLLQKAGNNDSGEYRWHVDTAVVEAAISLAYWSCGVRYYIAMKPEDAQASHDCSSIHRIVAGDHQDKEKVRNMVGQIGLWACVPQDELARITYITTKQNDACYGIATIWAKSSDGSITYSAVREHLAVSHNFERLFGWSVVRHSPDNMHVLAIYPTRRSLATVCGQEVFTSFLWEFLRKRDPASKDPMPDTGAKSYGLYNYEVTKLIGIFVENNLGSEMDAVFCIVPIVVAMGVPYQSSFKKMLQSTEEDLKRGRSSESHGKLRWGLRCIKLELIQHQIEDFFLNSAWHLFAAIQQDKSGETRLMDDLIDCGLSAPVSELNLTLIEHIVGRLRIYRGMHENFPNKTWIDDFVHPPLPSYLPMGRKMYGRNVAQCIQYNDPYGALIYMGPLISQTERIDPIIPISIAQQKDPVWALFVDTIITRRNIFGTTDGDGRNCFSWACSDGSREMAACLYKMYQDLYATDTKGWTAVRHALAKGRVDIFKWLIHEPDGAGMIARDFKIMFEVLGSKEIKLDKALSPFERSGLVRFGLEQALSHIASSGEKLDQVKEPWATGMQRVLEYLKAFGDDYQRITLRLYAKDVEETKK